MQKWCRTALRAFGVRLVVKQAPAAAAATGGPTLVVANHVSWLDALCIGAAHPCSFLAKAEARRWPVIGRLVRRHGGAFVVKGVVGADALRQSISSRLQAGASVCVFPEGTTSDGRRVLPFHNAAFDAAIAAGVPVRVFALRYTVDGDPQRGLRAAGWLAGSLASAVWRTLQRRRLQAEVLDLGLVEGHDRVAMASRARVLVAGALGLNAPPEVVDARAALAAEVLATVDLDPGAADLLAYVRQLVAEQKEVPVVDVPDHGTIEMLDLDSLDLLPILFMVASRLKVSAADLQELVTHETTLREFARRAHGLSGQALSSLR
ncbi:MAG TPA: lysophospholipid acyltransferase family protein [Ramlibacter sp.]|jgi:1-acyl-sn-glycerol-3-phosphate acyltransferase|uniref:lysophospholipid acyltransferase family protein n=1 Tax=Ramlibacter sp. TaxID=1917967 RepID=UPI002D6DEA1C|nr:lysophospholipid acyltransferase family protein [Ramlibacter sp.]HZY18505.1 lysophospholipid acyltransferase family protein [Ramlibacter sp.]